MKRHPVLAIDGPAGTGKTTSAAEVARRLGFGYVDSGALYRAIAIAARARGILGPDDKSLDGLLTDLPLRAEITPQQFRVFLAEREVTGELRDPDVSSLASRLAVHPGVRARVGAWLHHLAEQGPAVVEGRDIGTAIFPDAELKVFLTASLDERARRRALDLERQGKHVETSSVARDIEERDARDAGRTLAPLQRASDAVEVDTTHTDVEGQVSEILRAWQERVPPVVRPLYAAEQAAIRGVARLLWGLRVEGAERVPRAGGLLLAANHKSYLDPPLVGAATPREIHYLTKSELFGIPLLGAWIRANNGVPLDRGGFDRAGVETVLDLLGAGRAVLVFPEGTRIRRPGLGPPREGIAWLAAKARIPVVPVYLKGTWGPERRWFRAGGITVRFGEPVRFDPLPAGRAGREQLPDLADRILQAIAALEPARQTG
jgi:cytidylate kinase